MERRDLAGWILGGLGTALCLASSLLLSTRSVELNLGPGDTPFIAGFESDSEVENKIGWHWTKYNAAIHLPFETAESALETTLRFARVFGEEALVEVLVGSVAADTFRARGGEVRTMTLVTPGVQGPLDMAIRTDSHEGRDMGLRMDRVSVRVVSGAPLRLRRVSALRPPVIAVMLLGALLLLGASPLAAGATTLFAALAFSARASIDLFAAWRQTNTAPEMLIVSTLMLLALREAMCRGMGLARADAVRLVVAALVTMLFRLTLVFHPDFYYPDLLTHARVVEAIRAEGPAFYLSPAEALNTQGAWTKPVLGSMSSLPYAVAFHTPFALIASVFSLSTDQIQTTIKAGSCLISVLPILLVGLLAARVSIPPMAALALCVIPTYTSRLSFALLPALFGHVFDLVVLLTLATIIGRGPEVRAGSRWGWLAGALLAGHLAYTSSVVNEGLLMAILVALFLSSGAAGLPAASRLLACDAVAALAAFLLYYRHFVGDVLGLAGRLTGLSSSGRSVGSVYPIESFWDLLFERTDTFFGWPYVTLALVGLAALGRPVLESKLIQAWVFTYLGLILLRAKIPDVFRYGHETTFLTPLVATLAGAALIIGWSRGGILRVLAAIAGGALAFVSFLQQWQSVADQLSNAM